MSASIRIKSAEKKYGKDSDMYCKTCGDDRLIPYPSLKKKQCSNCTAFMKWDTNSSGPTIKHQR